MNSVMWVVAVLAAGAGCKKNTDEKPSTSTTGSAMAGSSSGSAAPAPISAAEVGKRVHLQWVIYFPWLPNEDKFKGETIYSIRPL